jgi:hypothetical protein
MRASIRLKLALRLARQLAGCVVLIVSFQALLDFGISLSQEDTENIFSAVAQSAGGTSTNKLLNYDEFTRRVRREVTRRQRDGLTDYVVQVRTHTSCCAQHQKHCVDLYYVFVRYS